MSRPEIRTLDSLPEHLRQFVTDPTLGNRTYCPQCQGGSSGELSLSIQHVDDHLVKLSCWRSTCDWWAYVGANIKFEARKMKEGRVFDEPTFPLENLGDMLTSDYGLKYRTCTDHGWRENDLGDTLILPVLDAYGRNRGHITRTMGKPKIVRTYKATSQPFLDWWLVDTTAPVVVVEDALSACRLAGCGLNAVALLGTSMSADDAAEIAECAGDRPVHLALDNDAFTKSIAIRNRHAHVLGIDMIHCLMLDVKDMEDDADIRELFTNERREISSGDLSGQKAL